MHFHHLVRAEQMPHEHVIGECAQTSAEACDAKFGLGFSEVFAAVECAAWCVKNYAPLLLHYVADIKVTWSAQ